MTDNTAVVAYLVEGFDAAGNLYAKIAHFTVDEARNSATEFARHYSTVRTTPLIRATAGVAGRLPPLTAADRHAALGVLCHLPGNNSDEMLNAVLDELWAALNRASGVAMPRPGHSWRDFGQLGGRNVSWCSRCDVLAFTGQEPDGACGVRVGGEAQGENRG